MQLSGATVIVTGASHGIGRAASIRLAERGAHVVGVGRDKAALDEVAQATGGTAVVSDVTDPDHVDTVVRRSTEATGRIDGLVLNAGIGWAGRFTDMPPDRIGKLLAVNVEAPMLLAREVLPRLVEQRRGALVFVTSVAGLLPVPQEAVYSATKTALEFFAEALWHELRGTGVSVSTVSPGVVRTDFFDVRGAPYERSFPRLIPPERIASAIVTAIETGRPSITAPRWLGYPARLRGMAPGLYRALSRLGV